MERADFLHLLRHFEHASAAEPRAYRRGVALFAALGYLWVLGCAALGLGLLVWIGWRLGHGARVHSGLIWGGFAALALLWSSLSALWLRLDAPSGQALTRADAPGLFALLERIRAKTQGPRIDGVFIDDAFNAHIEQHPRWGLIGGTVNYLTVGLPLLLALDTRRLAAVLAHECGHLRGDHGRLSAWIYRCRVAWGRLYEGLRGDATVMGAVTGRFLDWYYPRFAARSFALARQDEYEADRVAARLVGADAAAALLEIAVKGAWLQQRFWPGHWRGAGGQALPRGPFGAMRTLLAAPVEPAFAQQALQQALRQLAAPDDTHPVLRDRLAALHAPPALPSRWSRGNALGLLADHGARWLAHFDHQWCRDHATSWKHHHAYLSRVRQRHDLLHARASRPGAHASAAEWSEIGQLQQRLGDDAAAAHAFAQALVAQADHAPALRGLAATLPADDPRQLSLCERLYAASAAEHWWASERAVDLIEARLAHEPAFEADLRRWRPRLKDAQAVEERAWQALCEMPPLQAARQHELNDFELGELQADLARFGHARSAWLLSTHLSEFPQRRAYRLLLDLAERDPAIRWEMCRHLEQTLDLPGPVVVHAADEDEGPTLTDFRRLGLPAVYPANV